MYRLKHKIINSNFKIIGQAWDNELELPDKSYAVSDIQNYFEYIIKEFEMLMGNMYQQVCINRIENRITFKIKSGYYVELSTPEKNKTSW